MTPEGRNTPTTGTTGTSEGDTPTFTLRMAENP